MEEVAPALHFRLVRLEVAAEEPEDATEMIWRLWVTEDDDQDIVVLCYLRNVAPKGFGQARAVCFIRGEVFGDSKPREVVEQWVRSHVTEALYDMSRRALSAQAAAMDLSLDMPTYAPTVPLEWLSLAVPAD